MKKDPLIGKAFHTFDGEKLNRQGVIVCGVSDDKYLVQYLHWRVDDLSFMEIVAVDDMAGWQFYKDCEAMNFWRNHMYVDPVDETGSD